MAKDAEVPKEGLQRQREVSEVKLQSDDPESPHVANVGLGQGEVKPGRSDELFTDAELTDLALAADPDAEVAADAVPIDDVLASDDATDADDRLPSWYMPPIARGSLYGWRRRVVLVIVISFVAAAAYGVCSTYGFLGL